MSVGLWVVEIDGEGEAERGLDGQDDGGDGNRQRRERENSHVLIWLGGES